MADAPHAARLAAALNAALVTADGVARFERREVEDFFAYVLLHGLAGTEPSAEAITILTKFARRIGVPSGLSDEAVLRTMHEYFIEHPLNPALVAVLSARIADTAERISDEAAASSRSAFQSFFGGDRRATASSPALGHISNPWRIRIKGID